MKKFFGFLLSLAMIIGIGAATISVTGCSKDKKEGGGDAKEKKEKKEAGGEGGDT